MRKKEFIVAIFLLGFVLLCSPVWSQSARSLNFDQTKITGVVQSEDGAPVKGIRLDLELAPDRELQTDLNLAGTQLNEAISSLKSSVGTGTFVSVVSDDQGKYAMKGVPIPGVYYIILRSEEKYLPTRLKLILSSADKEEFKAPALVLRIRKGTIISKKALKEIEKSRKAMDKKDLKKAIKYMKEALKIEPKYAEGHFNLGVLYMTAKKRDEAMKSMETAVTLKKDYIPALEVLGELYMFKKDFNNAALYSGRYLEAKEKAGNLTIYDTKVYFRTGNSYRALKQMEKALPYFEKYLDMREKAGKSEKKDALVSYDLASYYYQKKNIRKAIEFYSSAIKLDAAVGEDAYLYLANSYLYNKNAGNALMYYKKYMALYPNGKNIAQVKSMAERLQKMFPKK